MCVKAGWDIKAKGKRKAVCHGCFFFSIMELEFKMNVTLIRYIVTK